MTTDLRPTILVVDDTRDNLSVIGGILENEFRVRVANSGERAIRVAATAPRPDLILLDIMMPEMDGYETLRRLREQPISRDIPVIFVTALNADDDEAHGLELGAVDYLTKPIRPAILLARIHTHLELKAARDVLARQNEILDSQVQQRTREIELIKDISLNALASLAEKRDNETGNHLIRTRRYIELLMDDLSSDPDYAAHLTPIQRRLIAKAAPLHDIGKVGIPDSILLKPGRLTPEEFEVMKGHALIGVDALNEAIKRVLNSLGEAEPGANSHCSLAFLEIAREIAGGHHEKWNGSGYPAGLAGTDIPLSARLMALADVFDALMCKRHYKEAFPLEQTLAIISEGRGTHFDPRIVDVFLKRVDAFQAIAREYADHP